MADAEHTPLAEERWYSQLIDKGEPGAWSYEFYVEGEGTIVARSYLAGEGPECAEDNRRVAERARLIAAAPDLLAVAELLDVFQRNFKDKTRCDHPGDDYWGPKLLGVVDAARDAIAKARGQGVTS